jgi:hypothetical protein
MQLKKSVDFQKLSEYAKNNKLEIYQPVEPVQGGSAREKTRFSVFEVEYLKYYTLFNSMV